MSSTATLPQQGTETVNSLAGKIKAKYPDYQSTDNHELVSRVITKHPEYQTHLSTEELQRIAGGNQQPEGSPWERLASGAGSAIKPFIPESLGSHIGSAVDMASGVAPLKALGGAYQEYKHGRETGQGVLPSIAGAVGGLTGIDTAGVRERAAKGDIAGIAGEAIPPIAMTLLGGEADRLPGIREGIGNRIHDVETGKLTPKVENISRAGGAAVGGGLAGSPGAITGGLAGPSLMESLFPEGAGRVAKRAENTRYSQLGEDLTRRGAEQEAIDRRAAVQQRQSAREQSQAAKPMQDFMAGKPGPFNKLSESPNKPPAPAEAMPSILSPSDVKPMGASGSEGTAARWTNERVRELAGQGNRTAIEQMNRRGIQLPENARYVMGDPDYPRTVLNPKETTIFSPQGTPIRDMAPAAKSSKARLVTGEGEPLQPILPRINEPLQPMKPPPAAAEAPAPQLEAEQPGVFARAAERTGAPSAEDALRKKMKDINDRLSYTTNNAATNKLIKQHRELERRLDEVKRTQQGGTSSYKPPKETFPEHSPEVMDAAQQELKNAVNLWDSLPAPARYRLDVDEEGFPLPPRQQTWTGSSSPRPDVEALFPWVKTMPEGGLSELKRVSESQKGLIYKRWLEAAANHIERHKEDYLESHARTREPGEE